jgi:hypothetical protein
MLPYQYGHNFDRRDNGQAFVVHPGDWVTVRLPEESHHWTIQECPTGFSFDMALTEDVTEEPVHVVSLRVEDNAPIGRGVLTLCSGALAQWQAVFDVVLG